MGYLHDVLCPFAVVTHFAPDSAIVLPQCPDLSHLVTQFDQLRDSDNFFFALRVEGHFGYIRTRAMCRTEDGVPLVQAAAVQPEFEFHDISGTLVGFWTPEYAKTLNVPGYHLHFLSADHQSGGHLLEMRRIGPATANSTSGRFSHRVARNRGLRQSRLAAGPRPGSGEGRGSKEMNAVNGEIKGAK